MTIKIFFAGFLEKTATSKNKNKKCKIQKQKTLLFHQVKFIDKQDMKPGSSIRSPYPTRLLVWQRRCRFAFGF